MSRLCSLVSICLATAVTLKRLQCIHTRITVSVIGQFIFLFFKYFAKISVFVQKKKKETNVNKLLYLNQGLLSLLRCL